MSAKGRLSRRKVGAASSAGAGKERTSGREQGKRGGTNEVDLLVGSLVESFA